MSNVSIGGEILNEDQSQSHRLSTNQNEENLMKSPYLINKSRRRTSQVASEVIGLFWSLLQTMLTEDETTFLFLLTKKKI